MVELDKSPNLTINTSGQDVVQDAVPDLLPGEENPLNETLLTENQTTTPLIDDVTFNDSSGTLPEQSSNGSSDGLDEDETPLNDTIYANTSEIVFNETPLLNESFNSTANLTANASLDFLEENLSIPLLENQSLDNESIANETREIGLATIINGRSIFEDAYAQVYLEHYRNFSDVAFKNMTERKKSALLTAGNAETKIEGFVIDNKKYAIHLIACDREKGTCNFRVNGVLAKGMSLEGTDTFILDDSYTLRVKSITFDYCDKRPVCDYLLQSYDLVELEVVRR